MPGLGRPESRAPFPDGAGGREAAQSLAGGVFPGAVRASLLGVSGSAACPDDASPEGLSFEPDAAFQPNPQRASVGGILCPPGSSAAGAGVASARKAVEKAASLPGLFFPPEEEAGWEEALPHKDPRGGWRHFDWPAALGLRGAQPWPRH